MAKPLHLVKDESRLTARQQEALDEIQKRQAKPSYGEGTIDARLEGNYLKVAEILRGSVRKTDE